MKIISLAVFLAIAPLTVFAERLDPSGYFFPAKAAVGFESIVWIELFQDGGVLSGSMRMSCERCPLGFENRKLQSVTLEGRSISIRGVDGLTFSGQFLLDGKLSEAASGEATVLRGTLSQKNKEAGVEFRYSVGD